MAADVEVVNAGSFFMFLPLSERAQEWISINVFDALMYGDALCVEHRYACDLVSGMQSDGLVLV